MLVLKCPYLRGHATQLFDRPTTVGKACPCQAGTVTRDPFCVSRKGGVSHAIQRWNQDLFGLRGDDGDLFYLILSNPLYRLL